MPNSKTTKVTVDPIVLSTPTPVATAASRTANLSKIISQQDLKINNLNSKVSNVQTKLKELRLKMEKLAAKKVMLLVPSFKTLLEDLIKIIDSIDGK